VKKRRRKRLRKQNGGNMAAIWRRGIVSRNKAQRCKAQGEWLRRRLAPGFVGPYQPFDIAQGSASLASFDSYD
jgi:hypothetical protein